MCLASTGHWALGRAHLQILDILKRGLRSVSRQNIGLATGLLKEKNLLLLIIIIIVIVIIVVIVIVVIIIVKNLAI